jgi:poly(ADP-ribose) glycohydrolase
MKMIPYKLRRDNESIESFSGSGKVDFANEYIGGGALHGPCVQEEIMFANCPEMFVSMVFCEAMDANESIVL